MKQPKYSIGYRFMPKSKRQAVYTVIDIWKTYNNAGECVKVGYVCLHDCVGQPVTSIECETTLNMGEVK